MSPSVTRYYGGTRREAKDEEERIRERLAGEEGRMGWDVVALVTAFKSALLESLEIAILVVALGAAGGEWFESAGGALLAAVGLVALAVPLRTSLVRVPVQPTKFLAVMLLMGFGTYWIGEGLGYDWPTGGAGRSCGSRTYGVYSWPPELWFCVDWRPENGARLPGRRKERERTG